MMLPRIDKASSYNTTAHQCSWLRIPQRELEAIRTTQPTYDMILHTSFDPLTLTWSGLPSQPLFNPNASVADVLFAALRRRPQHVAQISDADGTRLRNEELRQLAVRVALNLRRSEQVAKGDVVAMVVRNHRLVAPVLLGSMALAAPVNTLDPDFKADEIVHMLRLTQPQVIFCDADNVATVREALRKLAAPIEIVLYTVDRRVEGVKCAEDLIAASDDPADEETFLPTAIIDGCRHAAAIVCSSGTTGPSKGVSISHALLLHQMSGICDITADDIFFTFSSLYWLSGLATLIAGCMYGITRIITTANYEPERMLRIVEQYGVTVTLTAPSYLAQLLQSPRATPETLRSLRKYFCGGSAVAPEFVQRIDQLLPSPIRVAYGLSEVAGVVTANRGDGRTVAGSAGVLQSGVRVQLRRPDGSLAGVDEDGEICVQLALPLMGYWGDETATRAAIDAGGWLCTGDVGHFDAGGNLYIVDRMKDILKYRGVQISPAELENAVLAAAGGQVAECCVVGVPDAEGSDLPAAVVVRRVRGGGGGVGKAGKEDDVRSERIEQIVAERFNDAKRLRGGVYFVERFPMTPSGKVLRREVRDMAIRMYRERKEI